MENVSRDRAHWFFPIAGFLGALALSSIPGRDVPSTGFNLDKLIHVAEYGLIAFFLTRSLSRHLTLRPLVLLFTILGVAAFGALDETYQQFTPGRDSSVLDLLADTCGAILGVLAFRLWQRQTR